MKLFRFKKSSEEAVEGEIVIIDDTPDNLHLLNKILSERGYKVRALPNGEMGLSACRSSPPGLVLLDINMPGMNGYEVAQELKADAATRDIPIIFISAMSQTEDKIRAFRTGGVDYVTKPLQEEEVLARVETHLSISRMRDQINQANQKLLAWNVEMSQRGAAGKGLSISEELAALFGKPAGSLQGGDEVEQRLSVLAVTSGADETLDRVGQGMVEKLGGAVIASFGGMVVGVCPGEEASIGEWLEEHFGSEDLSAGVDSGEGLLRIGSDEGGPELRVDFRSPAVHRALSGLGEAVKSEVGD